MKIAFVTTTDLARASWRFRVYYVGDALRDLGHEVYCIDLLDHPHREEPNQFDVVIFSAKHSRMDAQQELLERCKGPLRVFDICDDHFQDWNHPHVMAHYLKMAWGSDLITCSTEVLRERILAATQRDAVAIPEPLEFDEPRFPRVPDQIRRIFWHGHNSNLDGLEEVIHQLHPWKLHVCTNIDSDEEGETLLRNLGTLHPDVVLTSWSLENVSKGHAAADLVIVPVSTGREGLKLYKGAQRGVEAAMLGRLAVVSPIPAYSDWPVVQASNDMFGDAIDHVRFVLGDQRWEALIRKGQRKALAELSRPVIAKRWERAIEGAFERQAA